MKLSVIIPVYEEPIETLERAVGSIKAQDGYSGEEIEIILSCDKPDRTIIPMDGLSGVKVISCKVNGGAGVARQRGLDTAQGDYITFLDADDMWFNLLAYSLFLKRIECKGYDIAKFPVLEQMEDYSYSMMPIDSTWCFSKIYKHQFLVDNNIQFRDDLRVHEDSWFVRLAETYNPRIAEMGDPIYLWTYNPDSIVRRDNGDYWQLHFGDYIRSVFDLLILRESAIKDPRMSLVYNFAYAYATICRMNDKYMFKCIDTLAAYMTHETLDTVMRDEDLGYMIMQAERTPNIQYIAPRFTIAEFARLIKERLT